MYEMTTMETYVVYPPDILCEGQNGAMQMFFMKYTSYNFNISSKNSKCIPT
jgi:hypothetical protein